MLVICPTCQIFSKSFSDDRIASSLCSRNGEKGSTIEKNPRPVSRRGLEILDVEHMPVICPTGQEIFESVIAS